MIKKDYKDLYQNFIYEYTVNKKSIKQISEEYGIYRDHIVDALKENNIEIKYSSNRILPTNEIIHEYSINGKSLTQLAKEYKSSTAYLKKILIDNNVKLHEKNPRQNLIGIKFNHLTAIEFVENTFPSCFVFKCDCGNTVIRRGTYVKMGKTKDCGCITKKIRIEKCRAKCIKHGDYKSRLYSIWTSMKYRCENKNEPSYVNYGGRGISVCAEWHNYENFKTWALQNGYKDNLTIDRINVNGNYEPDNCRWATRVEQNQNKRNTRYISYKDIKHTSREWEIITGINRIKIYNHSVYHNWTIDKLIKELKLEDKINEA